MNRQSPSQSFSQEVEPIAQNFPKTAEFENKLFPETFLGAFRMDLGTLLGLTFYIRDHFFRVSVRRDISHEAADAQDQYQGGSHNEEKRLQRTL